MANTHKLSWIILLFSICLSICSCKKDKDPTLSSIGATFALPFYGAVFDKYYKETGIKIKTTGISSGAGLRTLQDKTIDFAYSEAIISEKELNEFNAELLIIPTCLGGVVIPFNIPGVDKLNLSGNILADIFMNKIEYWDNKAIKAINPNVKLPHLKITIVYRYNGSGTSYILSNYLNNASNEWKTSRGISRSLNIKNGIAVESGIRIASSVAEIEGAIGYTNAEYSEIFNLNNIALENISGNYIQYSTESVLAAADIELPDYPITLTNSTNEKAYPLSCYSWVFVYKNQKYKARSIEKYNSLKNFIEFLISEDVQNVANKLNYIPLPDNALVKAKELINEMEWK
ncbi:phosphate transport system substrate-binding protein [Dysgonomonadaceae bacterium PH5-43]|nr:phosphate transport system substrate-binding protein [Dysgonomonadaceae bacterium PH5-43]